MLIRTGVSGQPEFGILRYWRLTCHLMVTATLLFTPHKMCKPRKKRETDRLGRNLTFRTSMYFANTSLSHTPSFRIRSLNPVPRSSQRPLIGWAATRVTVHVGSPCLFPSTVEHCRPDSALNESTLSAICHHYPSRIPRDSDQNP